MNPKKIWANLAVSDLERTTKFYTSLGFKPNGFGNNELTSFFFGEDDFIIHFFLKDVLKAFNKGEMADAGKVTEIIYTLLAASREETDAWAKEVEKAGGTIISGPQEFGEGYYGFLFADPDGHRFNVFYM
jgi:predicted lactoylglutathione lyase